MWLMRFINAELGKTREIPRRHSCGNPFIGLTSAGRERLDSKLDTLCCGYLVLKQA